MTLLADRTRAGWIGLGLGLLAVMAIIAYMFLGTVVFGIFLYYASRPFHARIRPRIGQRTVSALLALLALVVPLVVLIAYTAAVALQEIGNLASDIDLGPYQEIIGPYLDLSGSVDDPLTLLRNLGDPQAVLDGVVSALGYVGVVGSGLLYLFVSVALAFYLLRDGHRLSGYAGLVNDEGSVMRAYATAVDRSLRNVYFGNILNAFLTAVIGVLAFSLLNLAAPAAFRIPSPALLGILAGAGSLVPVVGMKIVYGPLLVYLGAQAWTTGAGWVFVGLATVVSVVVVDFIPDLLLRPYVTGRDLHTGTVMVAYVLGPVIWGWYGLFLGPLVLVVVIHFVRLVLPELLAAESVTPEAIDPDGLSSAGQTESGGDGETTAGGDGDTDAGAQNAAHGAVPTDAGSEGGDQSSR